MTINGSKKQRGIIVPLVVVILPVLLFAAGWALDFGHTFVNKTRLQNALDATALSAAIAINYDVTKDTAAATAKGRETFDLFKAASGNGELNDLDGNDLVFEYSRTLGPKGPNEFQPGTSPPAFVRVTSKNMLNVTPVLIRIFRPADIAVPAIATAGPVGNNCDIMPFFLCADMTSPAGTYYGYIPDATYPLLNFKTSALLTSGNYGLLDLSGSQGGKDIREILQGKPVNTCPLPDLPLDTDPGKKVGNVSKGLNDRINILDSNDTDYPSPKPPATSTAYDSYKAAGGNDKRLIAVPIGDCNTLNKGGNAKLAQAGTACVFLTVHYGSYPYTPYDPKTTCPKKDAPPECSKDVISFQFIKSCEVSGHFDPQNPVLNGPYKIVLYKSPRSGDS